MRRYRYRSQPGLAPRHLQPTPQSLHRYPLGTVRSLYGTTSQATHVCRHAFYGYADACSESQP